MAKKDIITPWEVSGEIDYNRLVERFGTKSITHDLLERMETHSGRLHFMLRRNIFYSHRDLNIVLDHYENGGKFVLYTGRGPSGPVHLGHLIPWVFTKHLQNTYGCKLLFQFTDDEKMLIREDYDTDITNHWVYENSLDLMALGFDPENTEFLVNMKHTSKLFPIALKIAKKITGSTMRAVFGFNDESNLGIMFFPSMQAAPCFLESERAGEPVPCLIPAGIDQDPYWRLTRDIALKLGYPKPAQIHGKLLPGLTGQAKMSSSQPETAVYLTDVPELVEKKILSAVTPVDRISCPLYLYHYFLLSESDDTVNEMYHECTTRHKSCEECKWELIEVINRFLRAHQMRRKLIRKSVEKMLE
ncbi:tryptophan--tRNA ligase [Candidatus Bathyarchaeota archaeon]|nr:tryptophan--tRNA ligase [Candidatus Bathyarchaeota archaeon]